MSDIFNLVQKRNSIFEDYIRFFLLATGQRIQDLVLVEQKKGDKIHFWLERKDGREI